MPYTEHLQHVGHEAWHATSHVTVVTLQSRLGQAPAPSPGVQGPTSQVIHGRPGQSGIVLSPKFGSQSI